MNKLLAATLLLFIAAPSFSQIFQGSNSGNPLYWKNRKPDANYWQQDVHYTIKASMDETANRIDGKEDLTYTNNSPDTLNEIYFHLYQNAFNKGSYLHNLEIEKGQKPLLGQHEAAGEGTIVSDLLVDGQTVKLSLDNTVLQVKLAQALVPGQKILISMNFKTWYDNGSTRRRMAMYDAWGYMHYNGCQWYPKLCVYDRKFGWDTYQHLNKEFYGDFGTFDVSLDFPKNYVLEATGVLTNRETVLPADLRAKLDIHNFVKKPWDEAPSIITPYVKGERKAWVYHAEGVHDFAFTADPSYRIADTTWNGIECVAICQESHASGWQTAANYVAKVIQTFSEDIGPYSYPKMVAADARDGMEYPMLTLDGGSEPGFHSLLVHEIGHNWFYGMVGSNETYRAALDEGFTQFLTSWGLRKIDGDTLQPAKLKPAFLNRFTEPSLVMDRHVLNSYTVDALHKTDMPLNTHSNDFHDALGHEGGYRSVYFKTASMLYNLQYVLGDSLFQQAFRHYFLQWRFAHPYFSDFRASIIQFTHVDLNWFFDEWLETTKSIDYSIDNVKRVKSVPKTWDVSFSREGKSQMPIDFTVTGKDGSKQSYYIPNTWFSKETDAIKLGKWYGWSKINPRYTARVEVPSGLRSVQIDTSYRLADRDWSNNYFNGGSIVKFDAGIGHTFDRRHSRVWVRPDIWGNAVDGLKLGLHVEGSYLDFLHQLDLTVWWNSHLLQQEPYWRASGESWYKHYRPFSGIFNLATPLKSLPALVLGFNERILDGLTYLKVGGDYQLNSNSSLGLHWQIFSRETSDDLDYLISPKEWSSTKERPNSTANLSYNSSYSYPKGNGQFRMLFRAPFFGGNRSDAFNYSYVEAELLNNHYFRKLVLHTRFFGRYGTGTEIPYESALFAGGANPEDLMENKFTRSVGFVPDNSDWRGVSAYEPTHFQQGGGLNLRGYSGYFQPDIRDGEQLIGYKGRSGVSANGELDFERLIPLTPKATRNWLHISSYLFADAGIIELSRFAPADFTQIIPTQMWSDIHVDAGLGFAATIKKFGPFVQAKPFTIRVDLPLFLNRPAFNNPEYFALRYLIGIERAF
ncbi:MAG: M1 family metallopeptidase [Chitinophagaceae bacterium]